MSVVEPAVSGVVIYGTPDERVVGMAEVVSAPEAEGVMSDSLEENLRVAVESGMLGLAERMSHVSVLLGSPGKVDRVEIVEVASFPGSMPEEAVFSV